MCATVAFRFDTQTQISSLHGMSGRFEAIQGGQAREKTVGSDIDIDGDRMDAEREDGYCPDSSATR